MIVKRLKKCIETKLQGYMLGNDSVEDCQHHHNELVALIYHLWEEDLISNDNKKSALTMLEEYQEKIDLMIFW